MSSLATLGDDGRKIGIPPDWWRDDSWVFPMSEELPASAWHVPALLKELHAAGVRGDGITLAVNDTTGETDHPFLPKAVHGRDFTGSRNGLRDMHGHGTHCLGIAKAVAPGINLIANKVLGDSGSGSTAGINAGRIDAAKNGADIISESLGDGGGPPIAADLKAYDQAYEAGACICTAALGNSGHREGSDTTGRPGSYMTHNLGIANLQSDWRTVAGSSSSGKSARFIAPGSGIVSCKPGGGWVLMTGTSMACPWFAAACALVLGQRRSQGYPDLVGAQAWSNWFVDNKLTIDLGKPGWDPRYGNGLIDIAKTFQLLLDNTRI